MVKPRGRPFPAGNTVSSGRPPGSRNKATQAARALFSEYSEAIVRKCIAEAMHGKPLALRTAVDRILPANRDNPVEFELPAVNCMADLPAAACAVTQAVSHGELTPSEGQQIMEMLKMQADLMEAAEFGKRLTEVEGRDASYGTTEKEV